MALVRFEGVDGPVGHEHADQLSRDIDLVDSPVPGGCDDAVADLREGLARLFVDRLFVGQTAFQAPAHARDLGRIEHQVLVFCHADAHGLEVDDPRCAAEGLATGTDPTGEARLVAYTDLAHLDACVESSGEVSDQVAEVDAFFGGEVEEDLVAALEILRTDQLHLEVMFPDPLPAVLEGFLLMLGCAGDPGIVGVDLSYDAREGRGYDAALGSREDRCEGQAPFGVDENGVPQRQAELPGVELDTGGGGNLRFDDGAEVTVEEVIVVGECRAAFAKLEIIVVGDRLSFRFGAARGGGSDLFEGMAAGIVL